MFIDKFGQTPRQDRNSHPIIKRSNYHRGAFRIVRQLQHIYCRLKYNQKQGYLELNTVWLHTAKTAQYAADNDGSFDSMHKLSAGDGLTVPKLSQSSFKYDFHKLCCHNNNLEQTKY